MPHVTTCRLCDESLSPYAGIGRPRQYCSRRCQQRAKRLRALCPLSLSQPHAYVTLSPRSRIACVGCGELFRRPPGVRWIKYCSAACRDHHSYLRNGKKLYPLSAGRRPCAVCGWSYDAAQNSTVCSVACLTFGRDGQGRIANATRVYWPPPCRGCGSDLGPRRFWRFEVCDDCRRANLRAHSRRKSARRRGAKIRGEAFTLEQVGSRDGWVCHLCSGSVDPALSGMDPQGPTIDHLVPISRGGVDELVNVALAHRLCNIRRGADRLPAQLRLIA